MFFGRQGKGMEAKQGMGAKRRTSVAAGVLAVAVALLMAWILAEAGVRGWHPAAGRPCYPPAMIDRAGEAAWPGAHTITAPASPPLPAGFHGFRPPMHASSGFRAGRLFFSRLAGYSVSGNATWNYPP